MTFSPLFADRRRAGQQLADAIAAEIAQLPADSQVRTVVCALPRGGLPVAEPIARRLRCPLSVVVAKKITRPGNPELAFGAVTASGQVVWSRDNAPHTMSEREENRESFWEMQRFKAQQKAKAQLAQLSVSCPQIIVAGAISLVVDDGIATGMTMAVAVEELRSRNPAQVWICAPVAPASALDTLQKWGDRVIVLATPVPFGSVSRFYADFPQVEMSEAIAYLQTQQQWLPESFGLREGSLDSSDPDS